MRVRLLRMSRYATVALRSIILVRHTVRWRVGLIPVFRTRCSEIRTPSLLTGKLVLNQGSPSRSGDLVHIGGGTRESYRVRVERRDFARLLAHSRIKETGCRRQTRSESLGVEQSECRFASSREVEGSGPVGEGLDWGISSDRAGEGRGLQNFVGVLGFMLPRYLFYSTMFTVMLALYPIIYRPDFSTHNIMAFVFGISAVAVSWSETWRAWRLRPF